jgi:hypothetical protein
VLVATIQGASQLQRQSDLRARSSNESDQRQRAATTSFIHPWAAHQGHESLIFVLQNPDRVNVFFLGAAGTLPLGVAMLFAAVAGALVVALIGSARIIQLRRTTRRRGGHVTPLTSHHP